MGDTFLLKQTVFCGYAVENSICIWGAMALDQGVAPQRKVRWNIGAGISGSAARRRTNGRRALCKADGEPCAIDARRPHRMPRRLPGKWTRRTASRLRKKHPHWGPKKIRAHWLRQGLRPPCVRTIARWLKRLGLTRPLRRRLTAQGVSAPASPFDPGAPAQSGMDGGFQRMVSGRKWPTVRTVDRARSLQSLWAAGAAAAEPAWPACQGRLYEAFSRPRRAGSDSDRQRKPLRLAGAGGAFALERLVGAAGDPRGVYPASVSARQRGPRTISWGAETGNHPAGGLDAPRAAASNDGLAAELQPGAATRSAGPETARPSLPEKPAALSQERFPDSKYGRG